MTDHFFSYDVPNMILAAAMYTLMGRFVLSFFFIHESQTTFWRVFRQITDPILKLIALITPAVVPTRLLVVAAIIWMFIFRIVFFLVAVMYGFAPKIGAL